MTSTELEKIKNTYCAGEPFVTVKTASKHLGISIWTMYRLAEAGKVPSHRFCGRLRFKISELEAVLNK